MLTAGSFAGDHEKLKHESAMSTTEAVATAAQRWATGILLA